MLTVLSFDLDDTLWAGAPVLGRAEAALWQWLGEHAPGVARRYTLEEVIARRRALAASRPRLAHDFTALRHRALVDLLAECGHDAGIADEAMAVFLAERNRVRPFADVVPVLRRLRGRFRLLALTNGNADVRRTGLGALFDLALSPAHTGTAKPDPEMFHGAARRLGVAPAQMLHVGDEPLSDVHGARSAGLHAVWINRDGGTWPRDLPPPPAEIASLTELPALVERIAGGVARTPAIGE